LSPRALTAGIQAVNSAVSLAKLDADARAAGSIQPEQSRCAGSQRARGSKPLSVAARRIVGSQGAGDAEHLRDDFLGFSPRGINQNTVRGRP
jgi:hypothetical protein